MTSTQPTTAQRLRQPGTVLTCVHQPPRSSLEPQGGHSSQVAALGSHDLDGLVRVELTDDRECTHEAPVADEDAVVATQVDEVTGLTSTVMLDSKQRGGKELRPTIRLLSAKDTNGVPVTAGALQPTNAGGYDAFLAKLSDSVNLGTIMVEGER